MPYFFIFFLMMIGSVWSANLSEEYEIIRSNDQFAIYQNITDSAGYLTGEKKFLGCSDNYPQDIPKEKLIESFLSDKEILLNDTLIGINHEGRLTGIAEITRKKTSYVAFKDDHWEKIIDYPVTTEVWKEFWMAQLGLIILLCIPALFFGRRAIDEINLVKHLIKRKAVFKLIGLLFPLLLHLFLLFLFAGLKDDGFYEFIVICVVGAYSIVYFGLNYNKPLYSIPISIFLSLCFEKILGNNQGWLFFACYLAEFSLIYSFNLLITGRMEKFQKNKDFDSYGIEEKVEFLAWKNSKLKRKSVYSNKLICDMKFSKLNFENFIAELEKTFKVDMSKYDIDPTSNFTCSIGDIASMIEEELKQV